MAKAEIPPRLVNKRCHSCNGPGFLIRYRLFGQENGESVEYVVFFHTTCVGAWVHGKEGWAVQFEPGDFT